MKDIKNPVASGDTQLSSILLLKCLQNLIHLACHLISPWKPRFFSLLHSNRLSPEHVGTTLQVMKSGVCVGGFVHILVGVSFRSKWLSFSP